MKTSTRIALALIMSSSLYASCGGGAPACEGDACTNPSPTPTPSAPSNLGFVQPKPATPKCYTPCKQSAHTSAGFRVCSPEGLMEGCLAPAVCTNGSCVAPTGTSGSGLFAQTGAGLEPGASCGADADCGMTADGREQLCISGACSPLSGTLSGHCGGDADCPDFQVCIEGQCFSNCDTNADCPAPGACYRHSCRLPCSTTRSTCPADRSCVSVDGTAGFCLPVAPAAARNTPPGHAGSITVALDAMNTTPGDVVSFTNVHESQTLYLSHDGAQAATLVVKKISHTEVHDDGSVVTVTNQPLPWIELGLGTSTAKVDSLEVQVEGTRSAARMPIAITIAKAVNPNLRSWEGDLDVFHPSFGHHPIHLSYRESPAGHWQGTMYYFNLFSSDGLEAWSALRPRDSQLLPANFTQVKNAFVQQWVGFKRGDNFNTARFKAMIQSTQNSSYEWPLMKQDCPESDRRCYPYDNSQGYLEYTSNVQQFPIPRGITELPIAMDLAPDPNSTVFGGLPSGASSWSGRVVSDTALHYSGDPKIDLAFGTDPTMCPKNTGGATLCQLEGFQADISIGGNYLPEADDTDCAHAPGGVGNYLKVNVPWLIPGFLAGTVVAADNSRTRPACRDKTIPFGVMATDQNQLLSSANPIPDGRTRARTLSMVDGFLVDQQTLVVLFREVTPSFLGTQDSTFSAYGFMLLSRAATSLPPGAFTGNVQHDTRTQSEDLLKVSCSDALLDAAAGTNDHNAHTPLPATLAGKAGLAEFVMGGRAGQGNPGILPLGGEVPHYLCVDTGTFDGGPSDDPVPCPGQSRVVYFTLTGALGIPLRDHSCNASYLNKGTEGIIKGGCEDTLTFGDFGSGLTLRRDPIYRCTDGTAFCDQDRSNLLANKEFLAAPLPNQPPPMLRLETAIDLAFQYKSKFKARSGKTLGFAPVICAPGQEYCYDPVAIEAVRDRVDCLASLYVANYSALAADVGTQGTLASMRRVLTKAFAYEETVDSQNQVTSRDGFERLNAELLVMLGDDAYTAAFASRFDLAGTTLRSFPGTDLEGPDGINLSGGAGFEMYTLYQSTQYYQLALERFYRLAPLIWQSISLPQTFVGNQTVSSYLGRVIRASTQKARASAEIARRYADLNRPQLARRVVQRAYTAAYLESMVISSLIDKLRTTAVVQDTAEIDRNLQEAAQRYRTALLDMADLNRSIRDDLTFFGYRPDYIPFPPLGFLETGEVSAFKKVYASALDKASVAAAKEQTALSNKRDFDTDAAAFQNELRQIEISSSADLGAVCGTFTGDDGRVYPATSDYAYLSDRTKQLGEPCGLVGNGSLFEAMGGVDLAQIELKKALQAQSNTLSEIATEQARILAWCGVNDAIISTIEDNQKKDLSYARGIAAAQVIKSTAERTAAAATKLAAFAVKPNPIEAAIDTIVFGLAIAVTEPFALAGDITKAALEVERTKVEQGLVTYEISRECDYATIDSAAEVKKLWQDMLIHDLDILEKVEAVRAAAGAVIEQRNAAQRLIESQREAEQLAIDVETARNDPNARIYKNDDIVAADRTFRAAVREAYKATKVFEYYTSQSYAHLGDLFLVRMVQHGDKSLEAYLAGLNDAFAQFQDRFGNPDVRVLVISVRDDVLRIPRLNTRTNAPINEADRVALFRAALSNSGRIDERGYVKMDFSTQLDELSPLTSNHKIYYVEGEYVGSDVGDAVGRLYLSNRGTGTVARVEGDKSFYALPKRTAILNTFFNGERILFNNTRVTDTYANFRLRDLPLINSDWELLINKRDEQVNEDINLASLTDIRLYFYYSDFTTP
ncbi:MAG: EB domain-containing protein [Myxococcota bacterium]